ncbi:MAG TPA: hypothetical protein P5550_06155, partial [Bacteroidales bacterium]|nr:hypothetical protein [Bacteroidales bacterium]
MKYIRYILTSCSLLFIGLQATGQTLVGSAGGFGVTPTAQLSWSLGEAITQTFSTPAAILTQGYQQPNARYSLFGQLTYANSWGTLLPGFPLRLLTPAGATEGQDITNAWGWFYVYDLSPGTYLWDNSSALPVGSVNATDALMVMHHFVGSIPLNGIWKDAGDVDASGGLNANDALQICRFFVDSISAFPAGAWLVEKDTLELSGPTQQSDPLALCYGDVNGSYIPSAPLKRSLWLQEEGELPIDGEDDFLIPIKVTEKVELGAISLVVEESKGILELIGISPSPGQGEWTYSAGERRVKLAWYTLEPASLEAGEVLCWIRARLNEPSSFLQHPLALRISAESELSDAVGGQIGYLGLTAPRLMPVIIPEAAFVGSVYPNPATQAISLRAALPLPSRIVCGIYDVQGKLIMNLPDIERDAGIQDLNWDV